MDREHIRAEIRAEAGTTSSTTVIVLASRMEPCKGHDLLLRALGEMKDLPDWQCWIIGGTQRPQEHQYLQALQAVADNLEISQRVKWLGRR